jgi:thioredoxin-like negative regulator of GroEL
MRFNREYNLNTSIGGGGIIMKVINTLDEMDEFIKNNTIAMIYFASEGCSVCGVLLPKIEEMIIKFPKVKISKVQIDNFTEAAGQYSIFTLPAILVYIEGKEIIREARFISVEMLERTIERYYELLF